LERTPSPGGVMTARVWLGRAGWYWRGDGVNCCGPFPTAAAATADAFKLHIPAEFSAVE
jgi:hypothetical protein